MYGWTRSLLASLARPVSSRRGSRRFHRVAYGVFTLAGAGVMTFSGCVGLSCRFLGHRALVSLTVWLFPAREGGCEARTGFLAR